ncbi:MAG: sigma-54-dependent Fis family transcriptional regulator [Campylobacteraceae bacterium]|nr:sigma-54-dependent Fis family transcriptional regulator [Campylobacteraceae bacterium]
MQIAIVEDQADIRYSVTKILKRHGYDVVGFEGNEAELVKTISQMSPDLLILDVQLGANYSGIDLAKELKAEASTVPIVLMTAYTTAQNMIEASKMGIQNILQKPFDEEALLKLVTPYFQEKESPKKEAQKESTETFIGSYETMKEIYRRIGLAANNDLNILIQGETGTGKELIAALIHQNSTRVKEPFVAVNCAAIPIELFESQLFGHEKGAFTDAGSLHIGYAEQVGEGTLFLDEVGELESLAQSKLLRFLETREFRRVGGVKEKPFLGRIVSATNKNLQNKVEAKLFREDLYFRLAILNIEAPPLRERMQDIPILAKHFINEANNRLHVDISAVDEKVQEALQNRSWSGNIRELRNTIFSASLNRQKGTLRLEDFAFPKKNSVKSWQENLEEALQRGLEDNTPLKDIEEELKAVWLKVAWENEPNISRLSESLGVSRLTLRKRLKEVGIYKEDT